MERHTFELERYNGMKSRHTCPACGKRHEFARYVDADGQHIADHVGRCNRESSCGYHLTPREFFQNNPQALIQPAQRKIETPDRPIDYVNPDVMNATLKAYSGNTFTTYLHTLFDPETVQWIIEQYGIGTTKDGSAIFWQVDEFGKIRTGKVIRYNQDGHRTKTIPPYFIHTKLGITNVKQCLFGQHLLTVKDCPIGLVESEKTACIMAGRLPDYLWMATGGKLNLKQVDALKGRHVIAFPDTDAFAEWKERLTPYGFKVSAALEQFTNEPGLDLADFVGSVKSHLETLNDGTEIEICAAGYPAAWK